MAGPKIQPHEWVPMSFTDEEIRQEREWRRLSSPFPPRDPPLIWIVLQHDCGASEDIKKRVAAIIYPKLPISP